MPCFTHHHDVLIARSTTVRKPVGSAKAAWLDTKRQALATEAEYAERIDSVTWVPIEGTDQMARVTRLPDGDSTLNLLPPAIERAVSECLEMATECDEVIAAEARITLAWLADRYGTDEVA